jgi:hypothetical protein
VPVRVRPALLVLAVGLTVGLVMSLAFGRPTPTDRLPAASRVPSPPTVTEAVAVAVLHDWDVRRAAAWAAGDARQLAALYTARSSAARADVALLQQYAARGLVVRGMRMQLLRTRVVTSRPRLLELEVTDRLARAVAVRPSDPGLGRLLPVDAATTRVLTLRRFGDRWLMARVSGARGR